MDFDLTAERQLEKEVKAYFEKTPLLNSAGDRPFPRGRGAALQAVRGKLGKDEWMGIR
jgi:hypothetical protein